MEKKSLCEIMDPGERKAYSLEKFFALFYLRFQIQRIFLSYWVIPFKSFSFFSIILTQAVMNFALRCSVKNLKKLLFHLRKYFFKVKNKVQEFEES